MARREVHFGWCASGVRDAARKAGGISGSKIRNTIVSGAVGADGWGVGTNSN